MPRPPITKLERLALSREAVIRRLNAAFDACNFDECDACYAMLAAADRMEAAAKAEAAVAAGSTETAAA